MVFRLLSPTEETCEREIFMHLVEMAAGQTKPSHALTPKPETPHLRFVKEYVRELIAQLENQW